MEPCLPSGLAKNDRIMSMVTLEVWAFFENGGWGGGGGGREGTPYTKAVKQDVVLNFSKV